MGRKETEEAIADCRAGRVTRVGSVAELLADLNAVESCRHTDIAHAIELARRVDAAWNLSRPLIRPSIWTVLKP